MTLNKNNKDTEALISGLNIPRNILGELKKTTLTRVDDNLLRDILKSQGYLFLPGLIDSELIEAAKNEVFFRLKEVEELVAPYQDGIFSEKSIRDQIYKDRGEFWRSVSSGKLIKKVTNGPILAK